MERCSCDPSIQVLFMFGMQAVPCIGDLSRKAVTLILYVSMGLQTVLCLAPGYGESSIKLDESLGTVTMGVTAAPYIVNTASSIAQQVESVVPFGSFSDLATSSRYITAEKALRDNPIIKRVVGDSLRW